MFFEVIPTEVFRAGGTLLTYASDLPLTPGQLVLVPLGRRQIIGIVWRRVSKVDFPTKPVTRLLHPTPLPPHLLKSILWLADYYLSPLPACANLMIPAGLLTRNALKNPSSSPKAPKTPPRATPKAPERPLKGPLTPGTTTSLKLPLIPLNQAQKQALAALQEAPGATRLLQGVTGSGKTNIYLQLAAETLGQQKSAILLVPEIALTSQLVRVFEQTFGNRIVLLHSNQTPATRRQLWLQILQQTTPIIVIGPRSALLAPLQNLGLIIIDEAHESTYYQENTPRYSALRLASFIASQAKIPCVQGTATPGLVEYHLAKTRHSLVELSEKAKSTAIDPQIEIVDLKDRTKFLKNRYFSDTLLAKIQQNLQNHHQTLIFHNRRGSAPMTLCEECGWQALCPNCYLPLTLHADTYLLSCHLCGHETTVPASCPVCHQAGVIHKGFGTKLLEAELAKLYPAAKIARFDGDNRKQEGLSELYQEVKSGEIDLLIGTQTLARGLDLPHLATVGVVQADAGLALPDFATEERTFELLTQVIGRVGRGHLDTASVVVQTYQPEHPVIQTALAADFATFANTTLEKRRHAHLPPFAYLTRLSVTYKTEKTTLAKIQQAYATLAKCPDLRVSPPQPAFHEHTARGFTWQLTLSSTSRETLRQALLPLAQSGKYTVVLDPPSLL